ncbi:hypothetical protein H6F86_00140 [Phormidium sp. FACHB-592]|uniref:HEAT repeat domain-containing protein n=1 Tax=Stenomitos frigidus AS-A4 TaxID=2933935 RepID=A0ABV0KTZ0_9CYAN|nr:hypothetical protein [Phormidium sp. FACHB-592]MBD2072343.1 hypothetical protein [Phormidium sp. FACHB-592]
MSAIEFAQALLSKDWSTHFNASNRLNEVSSQSGDGLEEAAEFLFSQISKLILSIDSDKSRRQCFESALGALNHHVPFGWDSFVDQQIDQLHSKQRDIRHQSVAVLVSVVVGSREMKYPNLERERIWNELIACLEHKDKHLRKTVAKSLVHGLAGWKHKPGARNPERYIPLLVNALKGASAEYVPACFAQLATCGYDISDAIPILQESSDGASRLACVMHALNTGDVDGALRSLLDEPPPPDSPSLVPHVVQRAGTYSKFQDNRACILFLGHFIEHSDDRVLRTIAAEGCRDLAGQGEDLSPIMNILCSHLEDSGIYYGATVGLFVAATLSKCAQIGATKDAALKRLHKGLTEKAMVQERSAYGLGQFYCDKGDHNSLSDLLHHKSGRVCIGALKALAAHKNVLPDFRDKLQLFANHKNKSVQNFANELLKSKALQGNQ